MKSKSLVMACVAMFSLLFVFEVVAQPPQGGRGRGERFQSRAGSFRQARTRQAESSAPKAELSSDWLEKVKWRSIGPANMSGRITSIAVYEKDPYIWYVATASGGLLKTTNNGVSFEHQFDDQATVSIGDVQVSQSDPNIVWIGTGEANPRNSVSWGDGVYKSTDGGKTWKNMGLSKGFQTGRIAIHPENPDIVYVGVLGRLWGPSEERGLYKTTDGGENWERVLYVDDKTGIIDVQMKPDNPDTLLVATYERQRDGFDGNDPMKKYGPGAGIYRTTDAGKSFEKMTQGLPTCDLGRVGLSFYRKSPNVVYAIIESEKIAQIPANRGYIGLRAEDADVGARITDVTDEGPAKEAGLKEGDIVVSVNDDIVHSYANLLREIRSRKAGDKLAIKVARDEETVEIELTLAEDPVAAQVNTAASDGNRRGGQRSEFTGTLGGQAANLQGQQGGEGVEHEYGGVYMSTDTGETWKRINTLNPRPMYYSQVRVDPSDNNNLYVLGTSLYRSKNGGEEFTGDGGRGIHPDHHALWINPNDGRHMILGNDGGIYVTWDGMDSWDHHNHVAIGQFYHVGIDAADDYKVYGGLQDNGSWGGPAQTRSGGPINSDWFNVGGGDGFIVLVDPNDPNQIYAESQNGAMSRVHLTTGERGFIRPNPPRREDGSRVRYRWNWKTPFVLSPHNPKIHYSAGNYVFRSVTKGNNVKAISPEITNTDRGAGSAISESAVEQGVIYVGTTDGAVWVTRDNGENWTEIFVSREESEDEQRARTSTTPGDESSSDTSEEASRPEMESEESTESKEEANADESASESAEESEAKSEEAESDKAESDKAESDKAESDKAESDKAEAKSDEAADKASSDAHPLVGKWSGELLMDRIPEGQRGITIDIAQDDGKLSGLFSSSRSETEISKIEFNADSGEFEMTGENDVRTVTFSGSIKEGKMTGQMDFGGRFQIDFEASKDGNVNIDLSFVSLSPSAAVQDEDPVSGNWKGELFFDQIPPEQATFDMRLKMDDKGKVKGSIESSQGVLDVEEGSYKKGSNELTLVLVAQEAGMEVDLTAVVGKGSMEGTLSINGGEFEIEFGAKHESIAAEEPAEEAESSAAEPQEQESARPQRRTREGGQERRGDQRQRRERPQQEQASGETSEQAQETAAPADDDVTGKWEGKFIAEFFQDERANISFMLKLAADGKVTGTFESMMANGDITNGKYDAESKTLTFTASTERRDLDFKGKIANGEVKGNVDTGSAQFSLDFEAKRVSQDASDVASSSQEASSASGDRLEDLVPGPRWVSSIEASRHKAGRVYLTLDGHRSNDDAPYVFVSENYGETWTNLKSNLPENVGSTRCVREDIENENVLYLGCEFGGWVSIDRGQSWRKFNGGLPTVAVHEFAQHPRNGDIVAGTHGRSLWVADVSALRQLSPEVLEKPVHLVKPNKMVMWRRSQQQGSPGTRAFRGENPDRNAEFTYHLKSDAQSASIKISDIKGTELRTLEAPTSAGLHMVAWDLRRASSNQGGRGRGGRRGGGGALPMGDYLVTLTVDGKEFKEVLTIESDPAYAPSATTEEEWEFMLLMQGDEEEEETDK